MARTMWTKKREMVEEVGELELDLADFVGHSVELEV